MKKKNTSKSPVVKVPWLESEFDRENGTLVHPNLSLTECICAQCTKRLRANRSEQPISPWTWPFESFETLNLDWVLHVFDAQQFFIFVWFGILSRIPQWILYMLLNFGFFYQFQYSMSIFIKKCHVVETPHVENQLPAWLSKWPVMIHHSPFTGFGNNNLVQFV